jgi:RNA polymerase sigma factor (sigma-70 family)
MAEGSSPARDLSRISPVHGKLCASTMHPTDPQPGTRSTRATMTTDEDLDLWVDAARAGGTWAFASLWQELSPGVLGYVRARAVPDPDDVTSEVFLAAFQRIGQFDGSGSAFRSWLFTIAHHTAVDAVRRGPAAREHLTEDVHDERTTASAEHDALTHLGDEAVRDLLGLLTDDQRDVVLLRVLGDLSLEQTAHVLGKPVGSVKQLQRRGLARLRRNLVAAPVTSPAAEAIA